MATRPNTSADPYHRAMDYWRSRGIELLPAATTEEIAAAFARLNRPLSADVARLYSAAAGFADHESDHWWSFWSLDRFVEENEKRDSEHLWFADWLIGSHMYAFRYISPDASAVFMDLNRLDCPPTQIANHVADFLGKYLDNPEAVEVWKLDD